MTSALGITGGISIGVRYLGTLSGSSDPPGIRAAATGILNSRPPIWPMKNSPPPAPPLIRRKSRRDIADLLIGSSIRHPDGPSQRVTHESYADRLPGRRGGHNSVAASGADPDFAPHG